MGNQEESRLRKKPTVGIPVSEEIEIYKLYREKVTHEDTLVNFRTAWFVTLQAFLFTAFALSYGRTPGLATIGLTVILGLVGVAVCWTTHRSVNAAHKAIEKSTSKWIEKKPYVDPYDVLPAVKGGGSSGEIAAEGSSSSLLLPWFVGIAWMSVCLLVFLSNYQVATDQLKIVFGWQ